jgi:hypothetical protein
MERIVVSPATLAVAKYLLSEFEEHPRRALSGMEVADPAIVEATGLAPRTVWAALADLRSWGALWSHRAVSKADGTLSRQVTHEPSHWLWVAIRQANEQAEVSA